MCSSAIVACYSQHWRTRSCMHFMTWWILPASRSSMCSPVKSAHGMGAVDKSDMPNKKARSVALVSHVQQFKAHRNQFFADIYQFVVVTAPYIYIVSIYYTYTESQLNGPEWSHSKWTQGSSEIRISPSISRATACSMPKNLKISRRTVVQWI